MGQAHCTFGCKNKEGTVFIYDGSNDSFYDKNTICYYIYKMNFNNLEKYNEQSSLYCFPRYNELLSAGWTDLTSEELSSYVCLLRKALEVQNQPTAKSANGGKILSEEG